MQTKYDHYLLNPACTILKDKGYQQVLLNIINDDESCITEDMKKAFFEHICEYDGKSEMFDYCSAFFHNPAYKLKGKLAPSRVYDIELGRVVSKNGFRRGLNTIIFKISVTGSKLFPISDLFDDSLLNSLLIESKYITTPTSSKFKDIIKDIGIENEAIQEYPMWTFEAFYDQNVYEGYCIEELPCILGLPGLHGTAINYNKIERITFSLRIPTTIEVKHPTSFDAGIMAVWALGGKTKIHKDCESKYGSSGFTEYIHEPITYDNITSELYSL